LFVAIYLNMTLAGHKDHKQINFRHAQNLEMVAGSNALVHDVQLYFIRSLEALSQCKI